MNKAQQAVYGLSESNLMEAHPLAGIAKKNGFKVIKVPKTVEDLFTSYNKDVSPSRECYTDDGKYNVHFYNGSILITELSNALMIGKKCKEYRVTWNSPAHFHQDFINSYRDITFKDLLKHIDAGDITIITEYGTKESFRFTSGDSASKDIFSPFALSNLKRVDSLPPKITVRHVMRLLANGQFSVLRSDFSYTDDYAFDNATGFGKADNLDPINMLMKMLSSSYNTPYSKVDSKGNVAISFGAHSNDANTLIVDLKGKLKYKI